MVLGLSLICLEVKRARVPTRGLEEEKAEGGANVPSDLEHLQRSCWEMKLFLFIIVCGEKSRLLGT